MYYMRVSSFGNLILSDMTLVTPCSIIVVASICWSTHLRCSGIFVQWISEAQLHLVINSTSEVELSTTSVFYVLNISTIP